MGEELKKIMQKSEEEQAELRKEISDLKQKLVEQKSQELCSPWVSCEDEMPDPLEQVIGYFPKADRWIVIVHLKRGYYARRSRHIRQGHQ